MHGGRHSDLEVKTENCRSLSLGLRYLGILIEIVLLIRQANWKCLFLVRDRDFSVSV